ncbi:myosin light chain kinase 3 [Chanos chanos]|uniref:Myosin light chain kinase 3 n=1 Tax=Chanos chanos TaxID=29144 RepID=A0A6J2X0E8_CHACN|nr:myosin light chain kinase 3 [Chanos chanos]
MSNKQTLATCIAKMYDGGRLDNTGASSGAVKKPSNSLLNSFSSVETKLNLLEGRVEQIACTQTEILQRLDMVCRGLGTLEKDFGQFRQSLQTSNTQGTNQREGDDPALLSEVRVLCGETLVLLKGLKQDGQKQREKIENIESSVSTLDKVLGYVAEAFRNSKIVEFILNGIVPWRRQGLLDNVEEEKNKPDGNDAKLKVDVCHREMQVPEDANKTFTDKPQAQEKKVPEASDAPSGLSQTELGYSDPPCPVSGGEGTGKVQRKAKEVTLKSREPTRVQTFAPKAEGEAGTAEVHDGMKLEHQSIAVQAVEEEAVTMTTDVEEATISEPERVNGDREAAGSQHNFLEHDEQEKKEEETDKPELPSEENLNKKEELKEDMLLQKTVSVETSMATAQSEQVGDESDSQLSPQNIKFESVDTTQETPQSSSDSVKDSAALNPMSSTSMTPNLTAAALSKMPDVQLLIIDDCPPQPAPFEHRIVSAKQVPMGSYYTVKPNELLGGGRFGQVHKCAELSSGLTLAAKIIKVKGLKEREEVKNEIGVMNQLNHVNLIQLYDAFESRTNLTLIMEYVEGGELFDRIVDDNFQLTELDAIVFTRQICEGVQYLHQQYILHLDLKPENILCVNSTGNQIKIIDFGLARKYRPREKLKVNFGTPEFLAPEVVNYDFVSFPTDMWSVGVITYMLLSGLSPFLGDSDTETMNNIIHGNWDFDAESFENVSEEAKDFISRLLIPAKCSRLSASGCMKHSWLNNLEEKAKRQKVRLKSQLRLQRYLAAHRQWKKHFNVVAAANRLKRFQKNRSISMA